MLVALVTGGASGIGLATVQHLVQDGFNVCVMDINQSLEKGLVDKFGDRILFHCGNVTKYEDQAEAFKRTFEKWGQLDFVFANAGIGDRVDFCTPVEAVDGSPPRCDTLVLDVCVYGVVWTSYLSLYYFRQNKSKKGQLVMTSSLAGLYPAAPVPLYGAAKHAVIGLGRSLAKRLQELNEPISVNVVCPGYVTTPLVSQRLTKVLPEDMITPADTIVSAIKGFLAAPESTGIVAECSGKDIIYRDAPSYGNRQSEYFAEGQYKSLINEDEIMRDSAEKGKLLSKMET